LEQDRLIVNGQVLIAQSGLDGHGTLPTPGPFTILEATSIVGVWNGTRDSAQPFVLGEDAVTANYSATSLSITQAPAGPSKVVTGVTSGGNPYTVKLTGPGELIVVETGAVPGLEGVVVHDSTTASSLTITVGLNPGGVRNPVHVLRVAGSLGAI